MGYTKGVESTGKRQQQPWGYFCVSATAAWEGRHSSVLQC